MDNFNDIEKRKYPRKSLEVLVNYTSNAVARSKDLSQGGICLITEDQLKTGVFLNLVFSLPNNEKIETFGKVVWSLKSEDDKYLAGIEFWELNLGYQKKIINFLDDI